MATTHYTAKVRRDGSLAIPREARLALNLQPGDHVDIGVDQGGILLERDELCCALDIGIEQIERGEYSTYTRETLDELASEVKAEGRRRMARAREHNAS
jgi:AbrB family looped-hinge helix DNA binding protein